MTTCDVQISMTDTEKLAKVDMQSRLITLRQFGRRLISVLACYH